MIGIYSNLSIYLIANYLLASDFILIVSFLTCWCLNFIGWLVLIGLLHHFVDISHLLQGLLIGFLHLVIGSVSSVVIVSVSALGI